MVPNSNFDSKNAISILNFDTTANIMKSKFDDEKSNLITDISNNDIDHRPRLKYNYQIKTTKSPKSGRSISTH